MHGSRNKVGIIGDLQRGQNSKQFLRSKSFSTGKLVASQQEMIPTNSFYLVQVVVSACRQLSTPGNRRRCEQNTFSLSMYRRRHFFSTSHMMLHAQACLKLNCVPKTFSHSISCFAPCLTPCTVHPAFCSLFNSPPILLLHWLRLKVEHVQNTLRRFTRPWR